MTQDLIRAWLDPVALGLRVETIEPAPGRTAGVAVYLPGEDHPRWSWQAGPGGDIVGDVVAEILPFEVVIRRPDPPKDELHAQLQDLLRQIERSDA
jgi:hypothetical protein